MIIVILDTTTSDKNDNRKQVEYDRPQFTGETLNRPGPGYVLRILQTTTNDSLLKAGLLTQNKRQWIVVKLPAPNKRLIDGIKQN